MADKRIQQHRNVIESAKQAAVRKIVYTSVQGAEETQRSLRLYRATVRPKQTFLRTLTGSDVYTNKKCSDPFDKTGKLVLKTAER